MRNVMLNSEIKSLALGIQRLIYRRNVSVVFTQWITTYHWRVSVLEYECVRGMGL